MAEDYNDKLSEGKLDLVPMIDCIMLLLLFFILTSKFTAEEKAIASILPTDKGQAVSPAKMTDPPKQINVCIYPEGFQKGMGQPSDFLAKLETIRKQSGESLPNAILRIGGDDAMLITGASLIGRDKALTLKAMDAVQAYVTTALSSREDAAAATRKDQPPIVINCFSGMPWKFAVVVYDSVRAYERTKSDVTYKDPKDWIKVREIDFAPPRIRNYSPRELGEELYDICNMQ